MIGLHKNSRAFLANQMPNWNLSRLANLHFPALEGFYFDLSRVPPVSVILPFVLLDCYIMLTLVLMLRHLAK